MTVFAPDNPDWTSTTSGGIVYTDFETVPPDSAVMFILTGVSSLVVNISAFSITDPITAGCAFFPPGAVGNIISTFDITGAENPYQVLNFSVELPAYGALMEVQNNNATEDINVQVTTGNRAVTIPRYIGGFVSGSEFSNSGPFVAGTPQVLQFGSGVNNGYLSNGSITVSVTSTDAGVLAFRTIDLFGSYRDIPIADVAVGGPNLYTALLPQCVGPLVFTPTTNNATPALTVVGYGP